MVYLLLALLIPAAVVAPIAAIVTMRTRRPGVRLGVAVAAACASLGLSLPTLHLLVASTPQIDVAGGAECWNVPEKATDIYAKGNYRQFGAEFTISEPDFVAYCRTRGWDLSEITEPVTLLSYRSWANPAVSQEEVTVTTGIVHDGLSQDGGFLVAYDRAKGKGYLNFASN